MKKLVFLLIVPVSVPFLSFSQGKKDKGEFVPYKNEFYMEIKEGINEFEQTKDTRSRNKAFKMDYSNVEIPVRVEDFTTVWCNDPLSQGRTGTCWCFASSSFYEAEIFRITRQQIKLSELYIVYWEYVEKSREYVRTRGASFFGEGSETNAVTRMMDKYGLVPAEAYSGMMNGQKYHDHMGLYNEMKHYLETMKEANAWNEEVILATIRSILNHYLGEPPTSFSYNGKTYTPKQFLTDVTRLKPAEYVNFMSLKEAPYYTKAEYRVPDNWWHSDDYNNVPLDDFMAALKTALKNGYSIALGGDVSESGYSSEHDVAMVPTYDIPSEYIDENARQLRFSNNSTTDDHAIHLIGYLDKGDDVWFLIKDSGSGARNGKHPGYYFYHEDYVKLKMMSFTVNKAAVKDILKKMKEEDS